MSQQCCFAGAAPNTQQLRGDIIPRKTEPSSLGEDGGGNRLECVKDHSGSSKREACHRSLSRSPKRVCVGGREAEVNETLTGSSAEI